MRLFLELWWRWKKLDAIGFAFSKMSWDVRWRVNWQGTRLEAGWLIGLGRDHGNLKLEAEPCSNSGALEGGVVISIGGRASRWRRASRWGPLCRNPSCFPSAILTTFRPGLKNTMLLSNTIWITFQWKGHCFGKSCGGGVTSHWWASCLAMLLPKEEGCDQSIWLERYLGRWIDTA